MPGLSTSGSSHAVIAVYFRIASVSCRLARLGGVGGVDHGFEGVAVYSADRQGTFGLFESKAMGDDVGDVDRAVADQLECQRIGVGVSEYAGHGELSSLHEGYVQRHGVGP